jgi:toxin ParE1/3/4
MSYKISANASNDLEGIWLYTAENWSVEQADRYLNLIFDEIEFLSTNPDSGKDFSSILEDYGYSKVKSHLIFYRKGRAEIEVIRILHQAMDLSNRLDE